MILIPHIANANGNLEKYIGKIRSAVLKAEKIVVPKLNISRQIDISFASIHKFLIPEDRIGGRTYTAGYIQIDLDVFDDNLSKDVIFEMLSHELAHAARWERNDEWTNVLFDEIINEGLATAFEEEIIQSLKTEYAQFFLKSVSFRTDVENEKIFIALRDKLDDKNYNYSDIFFDGKNDLPRWAGYSLGLYLVKKYLKITDKSVVDAIADKYSDFRVVLGQDNA